MSKDPQNNLTNEQLVARYTALSIQQYETVGEEDVDARSQAYTRLYWETHAISDVLRSRGVEARRALIPLLQHSNPQVRLNAAHQLLAIAHDMAYAAFERLGREGPGIYRLDARMTMSSLADGSYKPT